MITKGQAVAIAEKAVKDMEPLVGGELTLMHEATVDQAFGWVFFYQSTKFLESGSFSDRLVGNSPFAVLARNGEIVTGYSSKSIEGNIQFFKSIDSE